MIMENPEIEIAKKFFGKHFLNQFKLVNRWTELPKEFKKVFGSEDVFQIYSEKGDFLFIKGPKKNYLALFFPGEIIIADSSDNFISEFELGAELNLNVLGLTIGDIITHLKNQNTRKKIVKLTESELIRLVKKVISKI